MASFHYRALTVSGKVKKGLLSGDSEQQIRRQLKSQELTPLVVTKIAEKQGKKWLHRQIKASELALILQQLATLLGSGLPLDDCLSLMSEQSDTTLQKQLLMSWHSDISEGLSLSDAMRKSPQKIGDSLIAAVGVGEESGHLDSVILRLAQEQERLMQNKQTLKVALAYPAMIVVVAFMVLVFVMVNIVPQITAIFANKQVELPQVTQWVIGSSHFLLNYGWFALLVFVLLLLAFFLWLRDENNRRIWHRGLLQLPIIGHWLLISELSDWCRGLAVLMNSGVPVASSLGIAAVGVHNLALRQTMEAVNEQVRQGTSVHHALSQQAYMPGFLLHMIGSGEAGSDLDAMLMRVADYYADYLSSVVNVALKMLNPLLLIIIAMVVAAIIFGILTPIMQMNQMI